MAPIDDKFIRILVASDIHLGYGEKMAERSMDSFNSFDELLQIGKDNSVDMCILGGDLFHENKPTRSAQINCTQILSKHVFGNDPIYLEYASNPEVDFRHCNTKAVNYEDGNVNISLPIFSIHGNHDDPSGLGGHSCMDILHESKLVNYFGKIDNLKEIKLSPILIQKNGVKLAIYGLSSVKDERLHRLFREKKVIFETPSDIKDWFAILVLHQNRAKRGPTNYIPESFIPGFFSLVIWGHEHDCRIDPEMSVCGKEFYVCQPGSPVATSLCDGEAIQKKVGVLTVSHDLQFRMEPFVLQTVRPFVFQSKCLTEFKKLNLDDKDEKKLQKAIERELIFEVEDMIARAQEQLSGHPKQGELPLIRLRIEYTDERHQLNPVRFGNHYVGKVANPTQLLHYKKRTAERQIKDEVTGKDVFERIPVGASKTTEDYVNEYFKNSDSKTQMNILSLRGLNSAVQNYIHKSDGDAIGFIVRSQLQRIQEKLLENADLEDDEPLEDALARLRENTTEEEEAALASQDLNRTDRKIVPPPHVKAEFDAETDEEIDNPGEASAGKTRGKATTRARGRGRGAAGTSRAKTANTSTRRGAAKDPVVSVPESDESPEISEDNEDDNYEEEMRKTAAPTSRTASSRAATTPRSVASFSPPTSKARGGRGSRGGGGRGSRGGGARGKGAGAGQTSIMSAFATQSQRAAASSQSSLSTSRVAQRNRKQQFESDSDEDFS
eukprot:TRINITY_DN3901_c0_g1_i1.p1 TRINITY_DN3901_c0_g1~~TRINITY_DN3901_c0_g1_i1.p1  ORF type:complete len:723 (-),score=196.87 TRINITY_DN3901_c0_g1_i1:413-2581(-)